MRIGSLFSGYMGLDMAVEAVTGATTAWVSDIDKGACKILAHRAPDVPNLGDITTIDWSQVEPVDILTGGFPCQDLSHAGKRAGLKDGTRSGLWSHMAQAIDELRPRLVVAENVRGLLSAPAPGEVEPCPWCVGDGPTVDLRALGVVLADLADIGYDAQWVGLRAADVGACHGRFRIFLIAHPQGDPCRFGHGDGGDAADTEGDRRREGRPEPARIIGRPDVAQRSDADVTLPGTPRCADGMSHDLRDAKAVGNPRGRLEDQVALLPTVKATNNENRQSLGRYGMNLGQALGITPLLPTPAVNDMGAGKTVEDWDAWTDAMKAKHGNGNGHGASLAIEAQRLLPTPSAADALGGHERRGGTRGEELLLNGMAKAGHLSRFGDYAPAIARWELVIGRSAPSPTEPTGKGGAHRLSPVFVEWMMGLPEGWVTDIPGLTRNEALKALGNGVVPQQAAAALTHMLAIEAAA